MFNAIMLSITFALSFALMFLGLIVAIHFEIWIGIGDDRSRVIKIF